jgi:transaldolase
MEHVAFSCDPRLKDLALEGFRKPAPETFPSEPILAALRRAGTEIWLDTGDLAAAEPLWRAEMTALTTNNTLANQVVQSGVLDDAIRSTVAELRSASPSATREELVMQVGFVINCKIALRLIERFDCMVSVELHPSVAHDIEATVHLGRLYYSVMPDRFIIKVPLSPEGLLGTRRLRAEGVPVNHTIAFSARQNYLMALVARPNYTNVFLGRLNAVVEDNGLGGGRNVGEKATLASQRALLRLRREGLAPDTRQIAASMRNAQQIADLAGVDVQTIPPKAIEGFYALGLDPAAIRSRVDEDPQVDIPRPEDLRYISTAWEIDDRLDEFARKVGTHEGVLDMKGPELVEAARDAGLGDLFYPFSEDEQREIREHGKIPDLARWRDRVALDDLMTQCALQSFAADQQALDDRIASFL